MAQQTLSPPDSHYKLPTTSVENAESGDSYKRTVDALNAMMTELYGVNTARAASESVTSFVDVTITAAELKALNATPKQIVAAPGAGYALLLEGIVAYKAAGTAYADIASGEDLSVKYTDASGTELCRVETTGFLDQATAQTRFGYPYRAASGISDVTPTANAALVLHMLSGEITTGNSDLKLRVLYRTIPTTL